MSHKSITPILLCLFCLGSLLSACRGASQEVSSFGPIATYPKNPSVPIVPQPEYAVIVYEAYIELFVGNVDNSADEAAHLAAENGGYLASSQSWYNDGRKVTTVVLAVPTVNFENLRRSVLGMGDLVSESVSGDLIYTQPQSGRIPYSHITLHLRPKKVFTLPALNPPGWNPGRTFERAFSVFLTIFGFLADILIWVTVVGGPFLLIFLVARLIVRRTSRKT